MFLTGHTQDGCDHQRTDDDRDELSTDAVTDGDQNLPFGSPARVGVMVDCAEPVVSNEYVIDPP